MKSFRVEWALIQYDECPYKKRKNQGNRPLMIECHVKTETEIEMLQLHTEGKQGSPANQKPETGKEVCSPTGSRGCTAP